MKGFIHFKLIEALIPKKGKGQFVFRPSTNVAGASGSHETPPPTPTASTPPLNVEQLTAAANEITRASHQPPATTPQIPGTLSGTSDLNALPTSAPSSYLSPSIVSESTSSAVISISHTKKKVSSSVTDSVASLPKRSRPLSATAQAQQVGGAVMQEIAAVVKNFSCSMAPPDILGTAINLFQQHCELTPIQRLNIGEYLALKKKTRIKPHFSISSVKKRGKSGCHAGCLRLRPPLIGWRTRNYVVSCLFVVPRLCYVYYQLE